MRFVRSALVLLPFLPLAAGGQAAQVSAPGALYKSEAEGWQIQPPKAWKHAVQGARVVFASDTEAGLMLAWYQPGVTFLQVMEYAKQPYQEEGLVLTPSGHAPFPTKAGKGLAVNYSGQAMDGSTIRARAIAVVGASGAVYAAGFTTEQQFAALSKRVDELAKGISFFTPKQGAGVALINGPMCAWSGSSGSGGGYSSTQRVSFDGKGNVAYGSETTFQGETKNGLGDTTATWGGWAGNQHKPTTAGTYTVSGNSVVIRWADGGTTSCEVHHRNGQMITELKCDGKLYGRGLCD